MSVAKKITVFLPSGDAQSLPEGTTGIAFVKELSNSLAKRALAMVVNGIVWDLGRTLPDRAKVRFLTWEDTAGKAVFWHSTAHVLAEALEALYPGIQLGIGPPIKNGFYYDVDFGDHVFSTKDLLIVETKMAALLKQKQPFKRLELSKKEALAHYEEAYNPYKLELLEGLEDGNITFYRQGAFTDLCRGPHVPHTGYIKAIKLLNVAGAYWRGDINRKQLTRIYGISFPKISLLQDYMARREAAEARDHRKLGKQLGLFTFSETVGVGLPIWLPKGTFVRNQLMRFIDKAQEKAGYLSVTTPHIGHKELYVTSGHYDKYKEDTFGEIETPHPNDTFLLKPMNCPHHCTIYKSSPHSYRALPIRLAEFATVYRYEKHGSLHGLTRVRGFTQDDAHIFCRPDQVENECMQVIDLVRYVLQAFDFQDYAVQVSLRDPKKPEAYIGEPALWENAEQAIRNVVAKKGLQAKVVLGEAAFYGPKLDFLVQDALEREWQLGTVQIDNQLPKRFDLAYIDADNTPQRPVMIHMAPLGSLERFIAILLEHTYGKLPLWLSPIQVAIVPIGALHIPYAKEVAAYLRKANFRIKVDERSEKAGKKIRDAEIEKIPYMLIVGDQEEKTNTISIRKQGFGESGKLSIEAFIQQLSTQDTMRFVY